MEITIKTYKIKNNGIDTFATDVIYKFYDKDGKLLNIPTSDITLYIDEYPITQKQAIENGLKFVMNEIK